MVEGVPLKIGALTDCSDDLLDLATPLRSKAFRHRRRRDTLSARRSAARRRLQWPGPRHNGRTGHHRHVSPLRCLDDEREESTDVERGGIDRIAEQGVCTYFCREDIEG